jgi:hypothetical protein
MMLAPCVHTVVALMLAVVVMVVAVIVIVVKGVMGH